MIKFDCIIVLANEMSSTGDLNNESFDRLRLACSKFFERESDKLITCGWDYRKDSNLFIGRVLKENAITLGVPSSVIIEELQSRDTVGDAYFTLTNYVYPKKWKSVLVVTSDYHVPRTKKIFNFVYGKSYQIEVIGSDTTYKNDKQFSETQSLAAFEQTFLNIESGNIDSIYQTLKTKHPFYNGEIYSKI